MNRSIPFVLAIAVAVPAVQAQQPHRDHVRYEKRYRDPVLKEMQDRDKKLQEAAKEKTEEILDAIRAEKKAKRENRRKLRFDMSAIPRPAGPDAFGTKVWHFPPTPQYLTGTCWSFSTTSFMESEVKRLTGREIKLSEMWTAYWEYVEKIKGWIARRGEQEFGEGSESNALFRIWKRYGVVPRLVYEGTTAEDGRFDHALMHRRLKAFLDWCREENYWNEKVILTACRAIMDETMGTPPSTFTWEGETFTPRAFLADVLKVDPDDYVSLMSTLSKPFWTHAEFEVPDNWWHDASYVNVPLDVWYSLILKAIRSGHSMVIGGDVSEPGMNGFEDIAVIPTFDIPGQFIDQDSREFRIANRTTGDDHGIHLVGWTRMDGHDWFLIKDSGRSSRHGKYKGYYMYRDDFVKLKMLTFSVHREVVEDILAKVAENEARLAAGKAAADESGEKK